MNIITTIARVLLGLIFVVFGLNFWFNFIAMPQAPAGSPPALFFAAIYPTGFLAVVKVIEVVGGALLLSGRFATLGLTLVGPVVVNIVLFDIFLAGAFNPLGAAVAVFSLIVLYGKRENFAGLLKA
jgi:uncharacterized membrane protein YphA (DoxX/SURF4 family)